MGLPDGVHFTILLSLCVTDRQTDGQTRCCRQDRASIALRG